MHFVCLYFVSLKPAVLLVKGILAKLTCTVSVYQNQSVAYIISGPPPAPGCLPEWTAAVSTTRLFFLWRCALCLQTFLQSGRNNHVSNTFFFFFLVSRISCWLMRRGIFTIKWSCMLNHKGFSPKAVNMMLHTV